MATAHVHLHDLEEKFVRTETVQTNVEPWETNAYFTSLDGGIYRVTEVTAASPRADAEATAVRIAEPGPPSRN